MDMEKQICYNELEQAIGYRFVRQEYLVTALTHSSYANESKEDIPNNERQEFLGDAVLSIVTSDYLFANFNVSEGNLTKLRASVVCEQALFRFAQEISLGDYLLLGRGEQHSGGSARPSILADAFEALIAAIYLDGGIEHARAFILPFIEQMLDSDFDRSFTDYKTILQEIVQQNPDETVNYVLVEESGPDHDKSFTVEVRLHSNVLGVGIGHSKKVAAQNAAREALRLMGQ